MRQLSPIKKAKLQRLQDKYVTREGTEIHWRPKQLRLIAILAVECLERSIKKHNGKMAAMRTLYAIGHKIGIRRPHCWALTEYPPFWEAVNDHIHFILGQKGYHEVAKKIYEAALNGDHNDRRLYLEVMRDHKRKVEISSISYEEKLLELRIVVDKDDDPDASVIDVTPKRLSA